MVRDLADPLAALAALEADRRIVQLRLAGESRWVGIEDVARYRDALGASPPPGVAETWLAAAGDARFGAAAHAAVRAVRLDWHLDTVRGLERRDLRRASRG